MNSEKYIRLDVHQATISVAVLDSTGKLVMESILETKAATILEFFAGLRGTLSVTFEEGTWAAWLYDVLKPHVAKLVVCNPRKNALLKDGFASVGGPASALSTQFVLRLRYSQRSERKGVHMNRSRRVIVLIMLLVLAVTLAGAFMTRGVMAYLPFLQARKGNWTGFYVPLGVVDQRPWQTAAALAALAQSAEEKKLAREIERLADHEVDQAFSQYLMQAALVKSLVLEWLCHPWEVLQLLNG